MFNQTIMYALYFLIPSFPMHFKFIYSFPKCLVDLLKLAFILFIGNNLKKHVIYSIKRPYGFNIVTGTHSSFSKFKPIYFRMVF
jgi:hypothetical protein